MNRIRIFLISILLTTTSFWNLEIGRAADPVKPTAAEIITSDSQTVEYQPAPQDRLRTTTKSSGVLPSPCVLQVQNIYLRQSFGYGAVGTKAITTCSVPVTSISHDTYIQKMGLFGWNTQRLFSGSSKLTSNFSQLDIAVPCTNSLKTTWTGYTSGVIVYQGVQYYATVRVANVSDTFNCGT
jgi:hypothetical protein